jgi:diguanylate cyclase (GGDEF)-like protein
VRAGTRATHSSHSIGIFAGHDLPWFRWVASSPIIVLTLDVSDVELEARGDTRVAVLCVDDEVGNLDLLERALGRRYRVLTAASGTEAVEMLRMHSIGVVLADFRMPGMDGADLLALAAEVQPNARRVVVTGFPEAERLVSAFTSGRLHYIVTKPWRPAELVQLVDQLAHTYRLEQDNLRLAHELRAAQARGTDEFLAVRSTPRPDGRAADASNGAGHAVAGALAVASSAAIETHRDALTGLYNHGAFQERLREEVARSQRYSQPLAILFADVDGFAAINADLGFAAGDDILRRIALILSDAESPGRVRSSDIVARFAGQEFVALLPETTKAGALTKAMRVRDAVQQADMPTGRRVTISVGVAAVPDDAVTAEQLLSAAETALRGAKKSGAGRVHFFDTADGRIAERRAPASIPPVAVPPVELDRFRPYHERMSEVISILHRDRSISCLLIDLSRLRRVEQDLGLAHHAEVYDRAGTVLDELRGSLLRPGDLICRTNDGDSYLVILAPRENANRNDIDRLALAAEEAVESALAPAVREILRDQPRITVGSARVLGNSMIRPERLIARLVTEAAESANLARQRNGQRDKAVLQDIILGEGLSTVFQPIVHLETGEVFGYEALTRGPRQTQMESPATLFSVADEVDLTFELDRACFRGALRSAVGVEPVHRLFLNLLPNSFYDAAFIEIEVGHLLEAAGLTPANIVFEITERLAIENFTSFRRALAAYAAMGFGVAIDDVGTRHSNLETVMALRPDFIKLSDVLTRGVARSTVKREMLRSLGHIAEAIDAVIVAEGIETADDLLCLRDLGVRYGQGYFIARPAPPFPEVRPSVKRAIRALAQPPQASVPNDFDEDGDLREAPPAERPGAHDADEDTAENAVAYGRRTQARGSLPPDGERRGFANSWRPLRLDDDDTPRSTAGSLIESLREVEIPAESGEDGSGDGRGGMN